MKKIEKIFITIMIFIIINMCFFYINQVKAESISNDEEIIVSYRTHVQDVGWQEYVNNGVTSGTTNRSLRLEGINIKVNNKINIKYQVHIQNIGWQDWKNNGEMAGTEGQSLRLEAIKISLENTTDYSITYRVHIQDIGWQDWKSNGEMAGTEGQSLRLEAIEIKLQKNKPDLYYSSHIQDIGWQNWVLNENVAGTEGKSLRMEAIKLRLENNTISEHIKYQVHIQDIGWQDWKADGETAGTIGQNKRMEAIKIRLEGIIGYNVEYRVHVQNIGWQSWVSEGKMAGTEGQSLRIEAIQIRLVKTNSITSNFSIDTSKYPGYQERINALSTAHPSWKFELLYTGVRFSDAVSGEYSVRKRNLVPTDYHGEWISGTTLYDTGWYGASEKAIAYYLDVRNWLNEANIFQFLDVNEYTSDSITLDGIRKQVSNSFLTDFATDIDTACRNKNVNPYYIIARLFQENGRNPSNGTYKMDGGDGKYYYNPFNIGATGDSRSEVYNNALSRAKREGWDTMVKALEGGINFCKSNWLENYQNTLYQNRFDIDTRNGSSLYTHQYMQNLMAAYSEAKTLKSMYVNTGKLESNFTFIIPVYEGLDGTLAPEPVNSAETYAINVETTGTYVRIRGDANTNSAILRELPNRETVLLSVQRGINSNWQKVITSDGLIGYISGDYVRQIDDVETCNYSAYVKTNEGSGCYIRIGPSTDLDRIKALSDGTYVTVIDDSTYKNINGYDWSRIMLSNGTQAFMPSKYLSR